MLTKNAVGNLINRYRAVLANCHLLNVLSALALATVLTANPAHATTFAEEAANFDPATDTVTGLITSYNENGYSIDTTTNTSSVSFVADGTTYYVLQDGADMAAPANADPVFIGNNPAPSVRKHGGGRYIGKNGSDILSYTFIGNQVSQNGSRGGAIYNDKDSLGTITDSVFIGNKVAGSNGAGGAIYNNKTIGNITGSIFVGNQTLNANGIGGAIYNNNTIGSINNSIFIGNKANKTNGNGGAIYNKGTIDFITNSTFIGNTAGANGGAIATMTGLTFNANGGDIVFTDNKVGAEFNAIYVNATGKKLIFNLADSGNVYMNDGITGSGTYTVGINGDGTGTFYLNDEITNVANFNVNDKAILSLGSYTHNDGTVTRGHVIATNAVNFRENSKLIVDGSSFVNGTAAIKGNGNTTITVNATSTLELKSVSAGDYMILGNFKEFTNNEAWTDDNISVANALLTVTGEITTGPAGKKKYTVNVAVDEQSETLAAVRPSTKEALLAIASDTTNPAFKHIDAIMSDESISEKDRAVAAEHTLSGRSADAVSASYGATSGTLNVITNQLGSVLSNGNVSTIGAVSDTSNMTASADVISDGPSTSYVRENSLGLHVWAMPFYQNNNSNGLKSNSTSSDSESNLGGLVFGADKALGDWRIGLAINAGDGGSKSKTDYATTDTDYNFFGFNLYAGRAFGDFGFTAQLGYSRGNYDSYIDQSTVNADQELDMTSHAYVASVRGTYAIETEFADLTPYLGLSFMHFTLDDAELMSVSGAKMADIETKDQNIWTVPFGVTISKDFAHNDWTLTPAVDLGGILAMGDLDSHASSRIGAAPALDVVADVVDDWTFDAGLSLTAVKGVATIKFGYDLQVSEHVTNHGISAKIGYSF